MLGVARYELGMMIIDIHIYTVEHNKVGVVWSVFLGMTITTYVKMIPCV